MSSSLSLKNVNEHSLGDPHIAPELVLGIPSMQLMNDGHHMRHNTMKPIVPKEHKMDLNSHPITNKNILSKKALDALNQTQKIFPFQTTPSKRMSDV
jgi:hypothetical protein